MKDNPAGTRRCKDVGIRLIFGRDQSDVVKTLESGWFLVATNPTKIRRLENFHFQPDSNVNPTSESNVIPTSYWRQMSAGNQHVSSRIALHTSQTPLVVTNSSQINLMGIVYQCYKLISNFLSTYFASGSNANENMFRQSEEVRCELR